MAKKVKKAKHQWSVSDKRFGPRSPEHSAAISLGMRRNAWNRKQRDLASEGLPHAYEPARYAELKGCHWCNFYGVTTEHTEEMNPYDTRL